MRAAARGSLQSQPYPTETVALPGMRCYGGVTVVLRWCYSGVTVVLRWCYGGVTVVLQWCYGGVIVVLYLSHVLDQLHFFF